MRDRKRTVGGRARASQYEYPPPLETELNHFCVSSRGDAKIRAFCREHLGTTSLRATPSLTLDAVYILRMGDFSNTILTPGKQNSSHGGRAQSKFFKY